MRNRKVQRQLKKMGITKPSSTEKPWLNSEGYSDPTAYQAIRKLEAEERYKAVTAAKMAARQVTAV